MPNMTVEALGDYLNPSEQLVIAAKVNRLCEINPEDFKAPLALPVAYDIIAALDPLVKPSTRFPKAMRKKAERTIVRAGHTEQGDIHTSFAVEPEQQHPTGYNEYRIGGQVITKTVCKHCGDLTMSFEPFWGRGATSEGLEEFPTSTRVKYEPGEHLYIVEIYLAQTAVMTSRLFGEYLEEQYKTVYEAPLGIPGARDKGVL
jgi:hypothetical protein